MVKTTVTFWSAVLHRLAAYFIWWKHGASRGEVELRLWIGEKLVRDYKGTGEHLIPLDSP